MLDTLQLPTPQPLPVRIGKYNILRRIAQGGMAEIFLASARGIEGFEKQCVLKRILPQLATNAEFVQMFLDEARIAASLMHPNIAQVFDIGEENGSYYFAMELLRGEDVRALLQATSKRGSRIAPENSVSIITGVCAGLHYAHEMRSADGKPMSIVHRDISPQNVFVTHDGNVKLCDFGIAKSAAQLTETRVGTLKGKIRYMSPEQCRAEPLDRRSDVFSLAIVLWELIALKRLYSGGSDFEVFKAIVESPAPRPSSFCDDVPPGLEAIVMKGLERRREDRFQTAQELQVALEDWARAERVPSSPVRLASYMTELFGPATAVEERVFEGVPNIIEQPRRPWRGRVIGACAIVAVAAVTTMSLRSRARPVAEIAPVVVRATPHAELPSPIVAAPPVVEAPPAVAPVVQRPAAHKPKPRPVKPVKKERSLDDLLPP